MAETDLISRQAEQDIEHCETCIHNTDSEDICILRECKYAINRLLRAQTARTNRQWIDFLSAQFDISRTSAKEMLHGMMQCKKRITSKSCLIGKGGMTNYEWITQDERMVAIWLAEIGCDTCPAYTYCDKLSETVDKSCFATLCSWLKCDAKEEEIGAEIYKF